MARVFGQQELKYLKDVFKSKHLGWRQGGYVTKLDRAFAGIGGRLRIV